MENVTKLVPVVPEDLPSKSILGNAIETGLTSCLIIGYEKDGTFFFSSTMADGPEALWLLEMAKAKLLLAGGA